MNPLLRIAHRVNTVEGLKRTPPWLGVEVDLRDQGTRVIVQHDPFKEGPDFKVYLKHFRHRFIILNVKCEGIEARVLEMVKRRGVENFFFLDLSLPAAVNLVRQGERRIALRCSEYEPPEACLRFRGKIEWAWIDCFNRYPSMGAAYARLRRHFKTCLVAPELQARPPLGPAQARGILSRYQPHAICTKFPDLWV